jgi:hypothetical protein
MNLVLAWVLAVSQGAPQGVVYDVPLAELALGGGAQLPSYPDQAPGSAWAEYEALWPRVELDGPGGEALYHVPGGTPDWPQYPGHSGGHLVARTDAARDLNGTLFLPKSDWSGMERLRFSIPAARAGADRSTFLRAELQHYGRLLRARPPGAAYFRHRFEVARAALGEAAANEPVVQEWLAAPGADDLLGTYGLLTGGRALAENLQLERVLPESEAAEPTVDLATLEGITVREFDWESRTTGEPALDPLAALVPGDQHALFFPAFQGLVDTLDESSRLGDFSLTLFEERSSDARTKERYEKQLCLGLDALGRALGGLAVASVAVTGSDPFLRSGSDLALVFEAKQIDPLRAWVTARQDASGAPRVEGAVGGVAYRGVVNATRSVSSYAASVGGALVVTNSLSALERIASAAAKHSPSLADAPEMRYFRQRYPRGAAGESAFLIVPDAALRRWCGPKWRIAQSRRVRATAVLAELAAAHAAELARAGVTPAPLAFDAQGFALGELTLTPEGPRSSLYGTLGFLTPVLELDLERVSESEARLYRAWRDGYQANWSRYFDPIALSLSVAPGRLAADLTVMPLIDATDYAELRTFTGKARLDPLDGDPHEGTLFHFAMALDPGSAPVLDFGRTLSGMVAELADPMGWLGGSLAVYAESDPFWESIGSLDDDKTMQSLQSRLNEVPVVLDVEVGSALKLAAFLSTLRGFVETSSPGLLSWNTVQEGPHTFVEVRARVGLVPDFSLFYATTPEAWLVSFHRASLVRALDRLASRRGDAGAAPPVPAPAWLGESLALWISREGLRAFQTLSGESWVRALRQRSFAALPILDEWKRLFPDLDPALVHERVFGEHLLCPSGSEYAWDATWHTMYSPVYGSPATPRTDFVLPAAWRAITRAGFGLTFEDTGLRARAEARRE